MATFAAQAAARVNLLSAFRGLIVSVAEISGRKFYIGVTLMFLSSIAEGIGIAMFLPALQLAGFDLSNRDSPRRLAEIVSTLVSRLGLGTRLPLAAVLVGLALVVLIRTAFIRLQYVYVTETVYRFVSRMDVRVYEAVVRANWNAIMRHRSSEFINLLSTEHERLIVATHELLLCMAGLLNAILYLSLALLISVKLTLVLAGAGLLLALALGKKTKQVHSAAIEASLEMMNFSFEVVEHLQNLKAVKAFAAQERDVSMFERSVGRTSERMIHTQKRAATTSFFWEAGSMVIIMAILFVALVCRSSSPGATLLLLGVFARMGPKFSVLYGNVQSVVANLPAHTRMESAVEELNSEAEPISSPSFPLSLRRSLDFEGVSFRYNPDAPKILDGLSISIPAGKITAIVGPSGAGKSTLADVAMGLLRPNTGRILLDQAAMSPAMLQTWRANIGYVSQDTVLFCDSIRANLRWGMPEASDADMHFALQVTDAEFVLNLPDGLETVVGERGTKLSHGERQRIALARAVLRNPSMLILDEATNNLDGQSEYRVMECVAKLRNRMTILMIAHRVSALRFVDLIYVLEGGRVVEHGSLRELLDQTEGRFRALYNAQAVDWRAC